ncbi:hypothetical protein [Pantoea sp. DY-17]|uniref:hypothetical protein n=1 Tax=Pantoea sp. DY-17 TaxID=2871490 RepID=UPI001C96BEE8|nr:hypothetical protein [Pantoea sp. DY-17]MBY4954600.1 hypothetical protein [Pantoea sp. DY-17]
MQKAKLSMAKKEKPYIEFNGMTFSIDDFMKMHEEGRPVKHELLSGDTLVTCIDGEEIFSDILK